MNNNNKSLERAAARKAIYDERICGFDAARFLNYGFEKAFENTWLRTWRHLFLWRRMFARNGESIWCLMGEACPYVRVCTDHSDLAPSFRVCAAQFGTELGDAAGRVVSEFMAHEHTCCRWPACQRFWEEVSCLSYYHAYRRSNHAEFHLPHMCPDRTHSILRMPLYPASVTGKLEQVQWCDCRWSTAAKAERVIRDQFHAEAKAKYEAETPFYARVASPPPPPPEPDMHSDIVDDGKEVVMHDGDDDTADANLEFPLESDVDNESTAVQKDPVPVPAPKKEEPKPRYHPDCRSVAALLGYPCACGLCPHKARAIVTRTPLHGLPSAEKMYAGSSASVEEYDMDRPALYPSSPPYQPDNNNDGYDPDRPQFDYYVADESLLPKTAAILGLDEPSSTASQPVYAEDDDGDYGDMDYSNPNSYTNELEATGYNEAVAIQAQQRVQLTGPEADVRNALRKYTRQYHCQTTLLSRSAEAAAAAASAPKTGDDYKDEAYSGLLAAAAPASKRWCMWQGSYVELMAHLASAHKGVPARYTAGPVNAVADKDIEKRCDLVVVRVRRNIHNTMRFFGEEVSAKSSHLFGPAPSVVKELIVAARADRDATFVDETGRHACVYGHGIDHRELLDAVTEFWWEYALALIARYNEPLEADRQVSIARKEKAADKLEAVQTELTIEQAGAGAWTGFRERSSRVQDAQTAALTVCKTLSTQGSCPRDLAAVLYIACCRMGNTPPVAMFLPYERLVIDSSAVETQVARAKTAERRIAKRLDRLSDGGLENRASAIKAELELDKARKRVGGADVHKAQERAQKARADARALTDRLAYIQAEVRRLNAELATRRAEDSEQQQGALKKVDEELKDNLRVEANLASACKKAARKTRHADSKVFLESPRELYATFVKAVETHRRVCTPSSFDEWRLQYRARQTEGVGLPLSVISSAFSSCGLFYTDSLPGAYPYHQIVLDGDVPTGGMFGMLVRYNRRYAELTGAGDPAKRALAVIRNTLTRLYLYFSDCLCTMRPPGGRVTTDVASRICEASCAAIRCGRKHVELCARHLPPAAHRLLCTATTFSDPETNALALLSALCDPRLSLNDAGAGFPWHPRLYAEMAGRFSSVHTVSARATEFARLLNARPSVSLSAKDAVACFDRSEHENLVRLYQAKRDAEVALDTARLAALSVPVATPITAASGADGTTSTTTTTTTTTSTTTTTTTTTAASKAQWTLADIQTTKAQLTGLTKERVEHAIRDECAQLLCSREAYLRQFHLNVFKLATQWAYCKKTEGQTKPKPITTPCTVLHRLKGYSDSAISSIRAIVRDRLKLDPKMCSVDAFDDDMMTVSRTACSKSNQAKANTNKIGKRKAEDAINLLLATGTASASSATPVQVQSAEDLDGFVRERLAKRARVAIDAPASSVVSTS